MEAKPTRAEPLTLQPLMHLELLVASLLPSAAILFVGVIGTRLIRPAYVGQFVIVFLFCVLAIFWGEFALISMMQRAIKGQFSELIAVCQAYLAGNKERRAVIHGGQELTTTLATALNSLLDFAIQQENQPVSQKDSSEKSEELLKRQLKQLAHEIAPVMDADLREKAEIAEGDIGIVIDACNYLMVELVQQIKWTRHASEQVINATREMLDGSIEFAQASETQLMRLSQTTETGEKLVAFIQHLSSTLQLCVDLAQQTQAHLEERGDLIAEKSSHHPMIEDSAPSANNQFKQLEADMRQQVQLLTEALNTLQGNTVIAESMIRDLHTFAQHVHHSSTSVLNIAERTNSLVPLAEQWRNSVAAFHLPGEDDQDHLLIDKSERETIRFSLPTPTPLMKRGQLKNHRSGEY